MLYKSERISCQSKRISYNGKKNIYYDLAILIRSHHVSPILFISVERE